MTGLVSVPFVITIAKPELTRRRLGTRVKNAMRSIHVDYRNEMCRWIQDNVPLDTGNLVTSLQLSVEESHVEDTHHRITLKLFVFTDVEYASHVNEMVRVNWSRPPRVYQFWDDWLIDVGNEIITDVAPRHFAAEGLT